MLYFLIILTLLTERYIEELASETLNQRIEMDVDIEQSLFNLTSNLISRLMPGQTGVFVFFYSAQLMHKLAHYTKDLDNYINIDKLISKIIENANILSQGGRTEELYIYENVMIEFISTLIDKSNVAVVNDINRRFFLQLVFGQIIKKIDIIKRFPEEIKNNFKQINISFYEKKNESIVPSEEVLECDKLFQFLNRNLLCFFNYLMKYTTDVTIGKRLLKEVEDLLINLIPVPELKSMLLEILIVYIYSKTTQAKNITDERKIMRVILSSIFEFLSEKYTSNFIAIPEIVTLEIIDSMLNRVNLFVDIICDHNYIISKEQLLNERYIRVKFN